MKVAACAYICEMTHGYENAVFEGLMGCMLGGGCLQQYPQDGPCIGSDEDGLQTVTSMDQVRETPEQ